MQPAEVSRRKMATSKNIYLSARDVIYDTLLKKMRIKSSEPIIIGHKQPKLSKLQPPESDPGKWKRPLPLMVHYR